jgi:hypothetical protein
MSVKFGEVNSGFNSLNLPQNPESKRTTDNHTAQEKVDFIQVELFIEADGQELNLPVGFAMSRPDSNSGSQLVRRSWPVILQTDYLNMATTLFIFFTESVKIIQY